MNHASRSAAAAVAAVGLALSLAPTAPGLVIRDDTPLADYLSPAPPAPRATGGFTVNGAFDSSGVLIAPGVVLGAAHAAASANAAGRQFVIGGQAYGVASVQRLDGNTDATDGRDAALFTLTRPVAGVTPATVFAGRLADVVGRTAYYAGLGDRGTGTNPPTGNAADPDGLRLVGQNVIESAGGTFDTEDGPQTFSSTILFADFDDGSDDANPLGSPQLLTLEAGLAIGDSGGGVFVQNPLTGNYELAALHSFVIGEDFGYGAIAGSTGFTPQDLATIQAAVPEPTAAATLLALVGLTRRRRHRPGQY